MALKDVVIRALWGHGLYQHVLRPFDGWHVPPSAPDAFHGQRPSLNTLCRTVDALDAEWRRGYADLGFPHDPARFHRKIWEFNHALYGLRRLRRLAPDAEALGVGAGHEEVIYFLANRLKRVVATDLYEDGFLGGEGQADVLDHPAKYAPFPYREDHLEVRRMNGLALDAPDGRFDIVFCLSSIEHFGSLADKQRALAEMFRVLKPGGVAVVTTEVVLNRLGRGHQYFQREDLMRLVNAVGFRVDPPVDWRIEAPHAARPLALPIEFEAVPHVILRNFHTIYTSVALFLMKPATGDPARDAVVGDEVANETEPFRFGADILPERPRVPVVNGALATSITVRNTSNHPWFVNDSHSHMVRLGAWFVDAGGHDLTGEPVRFGLPDVLRPGDAATIALHLTMPPGAGAGTRLCVGLVKERCFWFREKGVADVAIDVD